MKETLLKEILKDIVAGTMYDIETKQVLYSKIDQAFGEEEEKKWKPKLGTRVCKVMLVEGTIEWVDWKAMTWQWQALEAGIIQENYAKAEKFLEAYKVWVKNYKI